MKTLSRFAKSGVLILTALTGIDAAWGEAAAPPPSMEPFIQVQKLAEAGDTRHDFHLLLHAACVRETAGELWTIDAEKDLGRVVSDAEDDLSVGQLLMRAITFAPSADRAVLEAAQSRAKVGQPLGAALCGTQAELLRGTGYSVRLKYRVQLTRVVNLPPMKPGESVIVAVQADRFGRITFQLRGPNGVTCSSLPTASQTAICEVPGPGGDEPVDGYSVSLTNHSTLFTQVSIYVYGRR